MEGEEVRGGDTRTYRLRLPPNPPAKDFWALTMYDKADTNGTELRAVAGNFLYSTGANEFAGRFTRGHFDLPMMGCDIALDGVAVMQGGKLV